MATRTYDMTDRELSDAYGEARLRIAELEAVLRDAIEGWEDCAAYKGAYMREKHGDTERIAEARAVLLKSKPAI